MSSIEWTGKTWNPTTGCSAKSSGCANCYAVPMSHRLAGMGQEKYVGVTIKESGKATRFTGVVKCHEDVLSIPLRRKKPTTWFVNSMSDLFWGDDEDLERARRAGVADPEPVPFEFIDKVFAVMSLTPQHTFQILTKRPERMREYLEYAHGVARAAGGNISPMIVREPTYYWVVERWLDEGVGGFFGTEPAWDRAHARAGAIGVGKDWPLPNVWLGTSVEDQAAADARIPGLLACPAAVRFLSCEPLIGPVQLGCDGQMFDHGVGGGGRTAGIGWVIAGGESGPGARVCDVAWVRSIVEQCGEAGVPVFVKQLGARPITFDEMEAHRWSGWKGATPVRVGKGSALALNLTDRKGGDMQEWPEDLRVREMPRVSGGATPAAGEDGLEAHPTGGVGEWGSGGGGP